MSAAQPFVIAVDAGGTHTRVGLLDLDGRLIAQHRAGGGSPTHNHDAARNVEQAIRGALRTAGLRIEDAAALGVGTSGYERAGSTQHRGDAANAWVEEVYGLPGLDCPRVIVNDAVIAHRGALEGRAGIVVVAGTGSMILAIDEQGTEIESGQFGHYAGAARHLVHEALHRILAEEAEAEDLLLPRVLEHFDARDVAGLRRALLVLGAQDRNEAKRRHGALAPAVTELAGSSLVADAAIAQLAAKTVDGIALLAPMVAADPVPVALVGSLAQTEAFSRAVGRRLRERGTGAVLVPAAADPLHGAALLAIACARSATAPAGGSPGGPAGMA
ncbi:BadF/BadG/BcrA/BcrD ATPase family protein [Brachybacterium hainanense]|uniref:BadF/BadG/BcrA/BcrD ATPase family protein n=1 Tax=Brachybacterium hainanense TaxID=1541174 RepID=A0ABV6REA9_9MICO